MPTFATIPRDPVSRNGYRTSARRPILLCRITFHRPRWCRRTRARVAAIATTADAFAGAVARICGVGPPIRCSPRALRRDIRSGRRCGPGASARKDGLRHYNGCTPPRRIRQPCAIVRAVACEPGRTHADPSSVWSGAVAVAVVASRRCLRRGAAVSTRDDTGRSAVRRRRPHPRLTRCQRRASAAQFDGRVTAGGVVTIEQLRASDTPRAGQLRGAVQDGRDQRRPRRGAVERDARAAVHDRTTVSRQPSRWPCVGT